MTHRIDWLIPDHVLSATLVDDITAEEVQEIATKVLDQFEAVSSTHLMHLLVDVRHCKLTDKAWNYSKLQLRRHPNTGWVLVIGDSQLGGLVIAIFSKILQMKIHYSPTSEAAMSFITVRDPTVAKLWQQPSETKTKPPSNA